MKKFALCLASLCSMFLLVSVGSVQASQLWVSATGNDTNACSQTAPCLSFQGAYNKGSVTQINCLTSGNYGPIAITASITIDCGTGNIGNISVSIGINNNNGIQINTSSAATIVLRHLALNGLGTGNFGIGTNSFNSGTLTVEDCMIYGFTGSGSGIFFAPNGGRGLLQVSNSQIFGNSDGITLSPSGQIASLTLNGVELTGNTTNGLSLGGDVGSVVAGTMRNSVVGANGQYGVYTTANQVFFTVEESSIVDNLVTGIQTNSANSIVNVGASTIGGNGTGINAQLGTIVSFGNNQFSTNASDGNFSSTKPLK